MGGYTGFSADATEFVKPGDNLVAVKVTNVHDPDVLPGKDIPDYDLYGGLYRKAALVIKNRLYIPQYGIRVTTPQVSESAAIVHVAVRVHNDYADQRDLHGEGATPRSGGKDRGREGAHRAACVGRGKDFGHHFRPHPQPRSVVGGHAAPVFGPRPIGMMALRPPTRIPPRSAFAGISSK